MLLPLPHTLPATPPPLDAKGLRGAVDLIETDDAAAIVEGELPLEGGFGALFASLPDPKADTVLRQALPEGPQVDAPDDPVIDLPEQPSLTTSEPEPDLPAATLSRPDTKSPLPDPRTPGVEDVRHASPSAAPLPSGVDVPISDRQATPVPTSQLSMDRAYAELALRVPTQPQTAPDTGPATPIQTTVEGALASTQPVNSAAEQRTKLRSQAPFAPDQPRPLAPGHPDRGQTPLLQQGQIPLPSQPPSAPFGQSLPVQTTINAPPLSEAPPQIKTAETPAPQVLASLPVQAMPQAPPPPPQRRGRYDVLAPMAEPQTAPPKSNNGPAGPMTPLASPLMSNPALQTKDPQGASTVSEPELVLAPRTEAQGTTTAASGTSTPALRAEIAQQVSMQMVEALKGQTARQVEITLNPEELGRVRLGMAAQETGLLVHVFVERPETMDLLRRHISALETAFAALGYGDVDFSFAGGSAEHANDPQDGSGQASDMDTLPADVPQQVIGQINLDAAAAGGVDLRL